MEDPFGHIAPGLMFTFWSLYVYLSVLGSYLNRRVRKESSVYRAVASHQLWNGFNFEAYYKVFISIMFCLAFLRADYPFEFSFHHTLLFASIALSGLTDLILFHGWKLPNGIDYVMLTFFYTVAGFSMSFHLHGGPALILLHKLTATLYYLGGVSTLLEWKYRTNLLASLFRPYFTLFVGTWLFQIGYHVHVYLQDIKGLNPDNERYIFLIPCFFILHAIGNIVIMTFIGYLYSRTHWDNEREDYCQVECVCCAE